MSETQPINLKNLSNDELIALALECTEERQKSLRHAALLEHYLRTENDPLMLKEKAGEFELLTLKVQSLTKFVDSND